MARLGKRTKKFAASGGLKKAIESRRKHQKVTKPLRQKQARKEAKARGKPQDEKNVGNGEDDEVKSKSRFQGMSVDDFFKGDFMAETEDGSLASDGGSEDDSENDDAESFASVDEFDDEERHMTELSALAKKDPEFYKYLQEHDQELLEFSKTTNDLHVEGSDGDEHGSDEDGEKESEKKGLTSEKLRKWQSDILRFSSLNALRQLLFAFRASANTQESQKKEKEDVSEMTTESPELFNKLVVTALKYTPVVLRQHIPYKELPDGRIKPPTQNAKSEKISKMAGSFVSGVCRLVEHLSDEDTYLLALNEVAKLVPYISHRRKPMKAYLKMCLEMWANGEDRVRLAAFMNLRKLGSAYKPGVLDMVLRGTYLTLVRGAAKSNDHTLPSINLMKNTASDIFCINQHVTYKHAFGFIRQLAIHLRNSMKVPGKDTLKQVYNWAFVHCVDFWCMVLAKACDTEGPLDSKTEPKKGKKYAESELKPLIYPLVQVTLGALKLASGMAHYPIHLHLLRSLLHLIRRTKTYIPLAPFILPIMSTPLSPTTKYHASTLKPLDLNTQIHVPSGYLKTRPLAESIVEEGVFILGEWLECMQRSIAFPELVVPILFNLRRTTKQSKGGKGVMTVKALLERVEEGCKWTEQRRANVKFGPGDRREVDSWEAGVDMTETPVGRWVKVQRKARAAKDEMRRKAAKGEGEMVQEDSDDEPARGMEVDSSASEASEDGED